MLTRRTLLRSLGWTGAAFAAPPLLSSCGGQMTDGPGSGGSEGTALVGADVARAPGAARLRPDAASSIRGFTVDLYQRLAATTGNVVCSPYSVAVALAMTRNGAAGTTAAELDSALHVDSLSDYNAGLNALTRTVEGMAGEQKRADGSTAELALDVANSLWGQRGVEWEQAFLQALASHYGAGMRVVDYEAETEHARQLINRWTAQHTHDRIEEIIPAGVLDPLTRLVLVNAIYLKAPWEKPFEPQSTSPQPFHRGDGTAMSVETMRAILPAASHGRGDGWQSARLLYAGGRLAMTVVLPDQPDLAAFERSMDADQLTDILHPAGASDGALVDLSMPKWRFRLQAELTPILQALGIREAFTSQADLSAMSRDLDLYVSAVLHEAFIAVDEEGTEAAAATAVVVGLTSMPMTRPLQLDRPFLFVIHEVEHATPLFIGRVDDPSSGSA
jgi:serpin B